MDNELSQILVVLKMDIGMIKNKILSETITAESEDLFLKLDHAYNIVGSSIDTSMKLMNDLRNEVLCLVRLVDALKLYSSDFQGEFKIDCSMATMNQKLYIEKNTETSLFTIVR